MLQECPELFFTESSITYDAAHRERVDGIVPGNGDDPNARHVLRGDLHFADDRTLQKVIADG